MRKLYSLVLLGLLTSTSIVFAMDLETDGVEELGVDIGGFSSSVPGVKGAAKVAPEGNGEAWYDDEVASGSPDAKGRTKSFDVEKDGWGDESFFAELEERASEGTQDPLSASIMMGAARHKTKPSLTEMAEEDAEHNLLDMVPLSKSLDETDDRAEGKTPTVVATSPVIYFDSVPDKETAEARLTGLSKSYEQALHIQTVVHYLYHSSLGSGPTDVFDLNVFANQLSTCKIADEQSAVLNAVERAYAEKAFTQLIIGQDPDTINQLKLVMNYLYDPDNGEKSAEGFDVIDFESQLSGRETLAEQIQLLDEVGR